MVQTRATEALSGKFTHGLYSILYDHIQVFTPHKLYIFFHMTCKYWT